MSDIFQEVDEEVRHDRLKEYWRAYGSYIIAVAVLIVLITSGRVIWRDYTQSRAERESESFANALKLEEDGKTTAALEAYRELAEKAATGVAELAELHAAKTLLKSGKVDEAIATYDALSVKSSASRELRDLAALNAAALMMERDPTDDVRAKLEKLAVKDAPFEFSAKELLAVMAFEEGDYATARDLFTALQMSPEAPQTLRTRVGAYLSILEEKSGAANGAEAASEDSSK